jgi:hypothetical protein
MYVPVDDRDRRKGNSAIGMDDEGGHRAQNLFEEDLEFKLRVARAETAVNAVAIAEVTIRLSVELQLVGIVKLIFIEIGCCPTDQQAFTSLEFNAVELGLRSHRSPGESCRREVANEFVGGSWNKLGALDQLAATVRIVREESQQV